MLQLIPISVRPFFPSSFLSLSLSSFWTNFSPVRGGTMRGSQTPSTALTRRIDSPLTPILVPLAPRGRRSNHQPTLWGAGKEEEEGEGEGEGGSVRLVTMVGEAPPACLLSSGQIPHLSQKAPSWGQGPPGGFYPHQKKVSQRGNVYLCNVNGSPTRVANQVKCERGIRQCSPEHCLHQSCTVNMSHLGLF